MPKIKIKRTNGRKPKTSRSKKVTVRTPRMGTTASKENLGGGRTAARETGKSRTAARETGKSRTAARETGKSRQRPRTGTTVPRTISRNELLLLLEGKKIKLNPEQLDRLIKAVKGGQTKSEMVENLKALGGMKGLKASDKRKLASALAGEERRPPDEKPPISGEHFMSSLSIGATSVILILFVVLMLWIILQVFPTI